MEWTGTLADEPYGSITVAAPRGTYTLFPYPTRLAID